MHTTITETTPLPVNVVEQIKTDTTLQEYNIIINKHYVYIFEAKTKKLKYRYDNNDTGDSVFIAFWIGAIFVVLFVLLIKATS